LISESINKILKLRELKDKRSGSLLSCMVDSSLKRRKSWGSRLMAGRLRK
jgi:hypothetical protein